MLGKIFGKPAAAPAPAAAPHPGPGPAVKPLPPEIVAMRKQVSSKICNPFLDQEYVEPFFQGFVNLAWEYPASDAGHHREPFGLIVHSLGTALRMLDNATKRHKPPPKALPDWTDKMKVYMFLCGISHDLGKILEWQVDTGGYTFDPELDSLRTFPRPYQIRDKHEGFSYKESAIHGVSFAGHLVRCVPKFRLSRDYSPNEMKMVYEAIAQHHQQEAEKYGSNPYWCCLREADIEDSTAYEKAQMQAAAVKAAKILVPPMETAPTPSETPAIVEPVAKLAQEVPETPVAEPAPVAEVEVVKEADFAAEALQQHLISAVRNLVLDRLTAYNNSHLVAKEEGWLLLVAPLHVCDKDNKRPSIADELGKILGRNFDETTVRNNLFDLGLAVQVGTDVSRRYPNLKVETGGRTIDVLRFVPLIAEKFFSFAEIEALPSCRIRNLADFADPEFVNPEIAAFYASHVKEKLKGDYLLAALKALEVYDSEPGTPSVIDDGTVQEERDMPLWQHALEIAQGAAEGADTGDYAMLLVLGLVHDIGKSAAAAEQRKMMSLDHVAGGAIHFATKIVSKPSATRNAIMEMIKKHHNAPDGVIAERIRAAHQGMVVESQEPEPDLEPEKETIEEGMEGEVVELVAGEEPLPGVETPF